MSTTTSVPAGIASSRGVECGEPPCGPAATIGGNDSPGKPASRIWRSMAHATSASVRPTSPSSAIRS